MTTTEAEEMVTADAEAALELIRMLGQPGRFTEAIQALLDASPLVIGMVLRCLVSRRSFTVRCPACGHPVEHEHDPAQFAYPRPRLVADGAGRQVDDDTSR